jgi:hypothetical protein
MSVLLLFPRCPVHSSSHPQARFSDSPCGNSAAPPRPSPKAGAAFSLPPATSAAATATANHVARHVGGESRALTLPREAGVVTLGVIRRVALLLALGLLLQSAAIILLGGY